MTVEELKSKRKELGVSRETLADMAKVSIDAIYRAERGFSNPSKDVLDRCEIALSYYEIEFADIIARKKRANVEKVATIAENNARARELGLSYGTYMSYFESGYLETYIKLRNKYIERDKGKNIIASAIGNQSANGTLLGSAVLTDTLEQESKLKDIKDGVQTTV